MNVLKYAKQQMPIGMSLDKWQQRCRFRLKMLPPHVGQVTAYMNSVTKPSGLVVVAAEICGSDSFCVMQPER
jgi:hypothetical protein